MSQRESGYERRDRDLYETPEWVTEALCQHLYKLPWGIGWAWEPAAGSGKMLDVLKRYTDGSGLCTLGTDIHPLRADIKPLNFLDATWDDYKDLHHIKQSPLGPGALCGAIVTNPPYDLATEFIERALRLFDEQGQGLVAMLMRCDFDHAKTRSHLFRDCPMFKTKLILTKRITWFEPEAGAKGKSPSFNHAWYLWSMKHEGKPTIAYGP